MKKENLRNSYLCVIIGVVLLAGFGCKGAPKAVDENVWTLLERGDNRAKDFFLSEVEANARDPEGKTPLHYAAEKGDAQLTAFFLSIGANPNVVDNENKSPLGIALDKNDARIAEFLAAGGANIHLPINENTTAARIALNKSTSVFRAILNPASAASADSTGKTILHIAAIEGRVLAVYDILAALPPASSSIDTMDNSGRNALDYAFARADSRNHMEIAEQLILSGATSDSRVFNYFAPAVRSANYNIRRNEGFAPIHYAVRDNYSGLINFLFEKDIDVNIKSSSGATPLHEAARSGNIQVMRMLIEKGAVVNSADAKGNTPLHTGIPANVHREAVSLLLANGADPNLRDEHGDTPLHIVIILNRPLEVIQTLLGGGSDVHIRNMDGKTPLYIAVQEKRTDIIPLLMSYNSEIFAIDNSGVTPFDLAVKENSLSNSVNIFSLLVTPETVYQRDSAGNTMLHISVKNSANTSQIGLILDNKALVDARNREGDTALHIAVRLNQQENGEFLLSRGASIFTANAAGESPLYIALTSARIREWMINPATIIARDGLGNNMLHYAAQWKLDRTIPLIIQKGVPVEEGNATGETPLFMAVKFNSPSTIRVLLDNNASLNARDKQGNTLLHMAVRWNAKECVGVLISSGIDINAHSLNGSTALHDAVTLGMSDIESLLISYKANLEVRDIDGNTPFMEAVRAGVIPSIEKLRASGADPTCRNNKGDTPLHVAVSMERYDLAAMLLRMGVSIHARNTRNVTPFQISLGVSQRMVSTLLTKDRINYPDDMGNSALHVAVQEKAPVNILRAIINQGCRINAIDNNGKTPLRLAIDTNQFAAIKLLADSGADPFINANDNKSPSDIAFVKGEECIKALFSGKAINAKDSSANTILHIAARYGTPSIISTLIELGANKTLVNIAYETPADIAVKWKRGDNAEVLK